MTDIKFLGEIFHDPKNPLDSTLTNLHICLGKEKMFLIYSSILSNKQRLYEVDITRKGKWRYMDVPVKDQSKFNFPIISSVAHFPSVNFLLCGCSGGSLLFFDLRKWTSLENIELPKFTRSDETFNNPYFEEMKIINLENVDRRIKLLLPLDESHIAVSEGRNVFILQCLSSFSSSARLFDLSTILKFENHQAIRKVSQVDVIIMLSEYPLVASASGGHNGRSTSEILLWNWKTGEVSLSTHHEIGHSDGYRIKAMKEEFSARGHVIFSSAYFNENRPCEICEWDVNTGNCRRKLLFENTGSHILFSNTRFAIAEKKVLQIAVIDLFVGKVTNIINLKKVLKIVPKGYNREMSIHWRNDWRDQIQTYDSNLVERRPRFGSSELIVNCNERTCLVSFSFQANLDERERVQFIRTRYWKEFMKQTLYNVTIKTSVTRLFTV